MGGEVTEKGPQPRAGRCAIVGRPNVGKSTMLNAILGHKLVIASSIPGTTRTSVLGVHATEDPPTQIAFMDTPGLHRPKSALGKVLLSEAKAGLLDVDVVVMMVEAQRVSAPIRELNPHDARVIELVSEVDRPCILVINKIDALKKKAVLLPQLQSWLEHFPFAAVVPTSAMKGIGLDGLLKEIRERLPEGVLYADEFLTDRPERFFAGEFIREAIFRHTRGDIPQGVAVQIDEFIDDGALTRITATIIVEKPSHKGIVIGAGGKLLKQVGTEARMATEAFIQRKVFLKLWVKVVSGWTADATRAKRLASQDDR